MRRRRFCAAVALAAITLAACTPIDAGGFPEGVAATLVQQRADAAVREAQVRVHNNTDETLTLGAVRVDDPRFDGAAERAVERVSTLAAGAGVDVRVSLPPMNCSVADDAGPTRATLHLQIDGESSAPTGEVEVASDFLEGLHARECLGATLASIADIRLASFTPGAGGVAGMLRVAATPTGGGDAVLRAVHATPLVMFPGTGAAPSPLNVRLGANPVTLEIALVPQRCDPHVVQEDKRGTVFTFDVEIDGEVGQIDLPAPPAMKAQMLTWVAESCGFGGS